MSISLAKTTFPDRVAQFLFVFPRLDLIALLTGWNIDDNPGLDPRFALERVLKAVKTKP